MFVQYSSIPIFRTSGRKKKKIGLKSRVIREIGGEWTWRETTFGSSYREVLKSRVRSRNRDSTVLSKGLKYNK